MILVTGAAGFIGFHLANKLLETGYDVIGYDNVNDYYDPKLKEARLAVLNDYKNFTFFRNDLSDEQTLAKLFDDHSPQLVVHLAAQAGVRYSLINPKAYMESNSMGFFNILEACRHLDVEHLVYASSSSVYGMNEKMPFSTRHNVDHPINLYGATKRSNELMAHAYSHLYNLPTTGLRFFTVLWSLGRPDMALFKFTRGILQDEPIPVFNRGEMVRDFTYVDDIVEGVVRVIDQPAERSDGANDPDRSTSAPWRIYNIGNSHRVPLMDYIQALEKALGKQAELDLLPMQDGDVRATEADLTALESDFGYRPKMKLEEGIQRFVDWYRSYYKA